MLPARIRRTSPMALPISAEQAFTAQNGKFVQTPKQTPGQMHVLIVLGAHTYAGEMAILTGPAVPSCHGTARV